MTHFPYILIPWSEESAQDAQRSSGPFFIHRSGVPLSRSSQNAAEVTGRDDLLDELGRALLKALIKDFDEHGEEAIAALRENEPKTYLATIARLVPSASAREGEGGVVVTTTMNLGGGDG